MTRPEGTANEAVKRVARAVSQPSSTHACPAGAAPDREQRLVHCPLKPTARRRPRFTPHQTGSLRRNLTDDVGLIRRQVPARLDHGRPNGWHRTRDDGGEAGHERGAHECNRVVILDSE